MQYVIIIDRLHLGVNNYYFRLQLADEAFFLSGVGYYYY